MIPLTKKKLDKLIEQIPKPKPHLLLGELYSHNTIWGFLKANKKSTDLEKVMNSSNLCILNYKSSTYLNTSTGSDSAINITLSDPSSYNDPSSSDYFLIILEITQPIHTNNRHPCSKTSKAYQQ